MNGIVKNRMVYVMIGMVITGMIIWIIAGTSDKSTQEELLVNQETYTVETSNSDQTESSNEQNAERQGHFLIRAENGIVNVYWVDQSGEHLHRQTEIAYDLLSSEDQKILSNGVKLRDEDALAGFLENYDS